MNHAMIFVAHRIRIEKLYRSAEEIKPTKVQTKREKTTFCIPRSKRNRMKGMRGKIANAVYC